MTENWTSKWLRTIDIKYCTNIHIALKIGMQASDKIQIFIYLCPLTYNF